MTRAATRFLERDTRPDVESATDAARRRAAEGAVDALAAVTDLADPRVRVALAKVIDTGGEDQFVRGLIRRLRN